MGTNTSLLLHCYMHASQLEHFERRHTSKQPASVRGTYTDRAVPLAAHLLVGQVTDQDGSTGQPGATFWTTAGWHSASKPEFLLERDTYTHKHATLLCIKARQQLEATNGARNEAHTISCACSSPQAASNCPAQHTHTHTHGHLVHCSSPTHTAITCLEMP